MTIVLATVGGVFGETTTHAEELRTVSRNTLVFIDSAEEEGEWAAYRVVDERSPVVFQAPGPGRVLLKLRTFVLGDKEKDKQAVAAILKDQEIILTARVDPVEDPDEKLVDRSDKRALSKARLYAVRVGPGEHTVTIRFSEGAVLLVGARIVPEEGGELVAPERRVGEPVQRVGRLELKEAGPDVEEVEEVEEIDRAQEESALRPSSGASGAAKNPEAWVKEKHRTIGQDAPHLGPGEQDPFRPRDRRGATAAVLRRPLTVPVPSFIYEVKGGVLFSRLGLSPGPQIGMGARLPIPAFDPRRFTAGLSAALAYAQGSSELVDAGGTAALDVAKVRHISFAFDADLRWVFVRLEDVLDPYVSLGLGGIVGHISTEDSAGSASSGTRGLVGVVRVGAAFGPLGRRPFLELETAAGRLASSLTRRDLANVTDDRAGYVSVSALVGYRFEMLEDAPAE